MKRNFLLVENDGENKAYNISALQQKGLRVFVATTHIDPWLLELVPEDDIVVTDTFNSISLPVEVEAFTARRGIKLDAVGTFSEHNMVQAADLAAALGLIGPPPAAVRRSSNNKLLMRRFFAEAGIPNPKYRVCARLDAHELEEAVQAVGRPCVVKPAFGSGSCGVIKIEESSDLEEVLQKIKQTTTPQDKESFKNYNGTLLVEEFLEGPLISVDGIVQDGVITVVGGAEYQLSPEPWFVEVAYKVPATIPDKEWQQAEKMAKRAVIALGLDNCGFHCEQRLTKDGPRIIEIGARLPGSRIPLCYERSSGVNLVSLLIDVWLGTQISVTPASQTMHVVERPVYPEKSGRLLSLEGLAEAQQQKGVWFMKATTTVGDSAVTFPNLPKALYHYGAEAGTAEELRTKMAEIESTVKVSIE